MANRNSMVITKGGNTVITFRKDVKLSAEQKAWLHNHGLRKDKWEDNKYFINYKAIPNKLEFLKLVGVLHDRVLKLDGNIDEKAIAFKAIADRIYG